MLLMCLRPKGEGGGVTGGHKSWARLPRRPGHAEPFCNLLVARALAGRLSSFEAPRSDQMDAGWERHGWAFPAGQQASRRCCCCCCRRCCCKLALAAGGLHLAPQALALTPARLERPADDPSNRARATTVELLGRIGVSAPLLSLQSDDFHRTLMSIAFCFSCAGCARPPNLDPVSLPCALSGIKSMGALRT